MDFSKFIAKKDEYAQYMVDEITHICTKFEKRGPGSRGEQQACEYAAEQMKEYGCDRVYVEEFKENPGSFFGWINFTITFVLLAFISYFFVPALSIVFVALGLILCVLQFGLYKKVVDPPFPEKTGHNAAGFKEMLGQWAVSYIDSKGQQMTDQYTITFTELFPGKLYTVKGLGGQGLDPTFDDSVQVRFNGEGKPLTMSSGRVANGGQYEQSYDVYFRLVDEQYIYASAPEFFDKGNGTYGIGASINPAYGVALGAYAKSNGEFAGTLGVFFNMTMRKIEQSGSSASTEKFSRQETVSPTWKGVQPLRLEKNRFTPASVKSLK